METDRMPSGRVTIALKRGEGRILRAGGLWVYDNEIDQELSKEALLAVQDGCLVDVHSHTGYFMGTGFYNGASKIRIRLLTREKDQTIDQDFFAARVNDAVSYRLAVMPGETSFRVIFGEADFLPGLTVDKYADVLVVESLALGIDRFKEEIIEELKRVLAEHGMPIRGVYERSDAKVRTLEGMERIKGFLGDPFETTVEIVENGVHYLVDVADGQKTGFFLDQKYNRRAIHAVAKDAKVLDCFTHTGSFALNAGIAGAKSVLGVDASADAVAMARKNAELNGLEDRVSFETADVFELLPQLIREGEQYDLVILDPPAFTKSRASVKKAVKGYKEINLRGMQLVKRGGFLATCSCSHFMEPGLFADTIAAAAKDAGRTLRQVEFRTQAPDHPILWAESDSYYLKFYLFQVL